MCVYVLCVLWWKRRLEKKKHLNDNRLKSYFITFWHFFLHCMCLRFLFFHKPSAVKEFFLHQKAFFCNERLDECEINFWHLFLCCVVDWKTKMSLLPPFNDLCLIVSLLFISLGHNKIVFSSRDGKRNSWYWYGWSISLDSRLWRIEINSAWSFAKFRTHKAPHTQIRSPPFRSKAI